MSEAMFTGKYDVFVAVVLLFCFLDIGYCLLKAVRDFYKRRYDQEDENLHRVEWMNQTRTKQKIVKRQRQMRRAVREAQLSSTRGRLTKPSVPVFSERHVTLQEEDDVRAMSPTGRNRRSQWLQGNNIQKLALRNHIRTNWSMDSSCTGSVCSTPSSTGSPRSEDSSSPSSPWFPPQEPGAYFPDDVQQQQQQHQHVAPSGAPPVLRRSRSRPLFKRMSDINIMRTVYSEDQDDIE